MPRSVPVKIPTAAADRPRWALAAAIGLVCVAVGSWLGRATLDHAPPGADAPPPDAAPATATATATATDTDTATDTPTATATATPAPTPPTPSPTLSIIRGRIAYLRCDGAPAQDGPFPCPRDRAIEHAVWTAIDTLPSCPTGPRTPGRADLRVDISRGAPPVLRVREGDPEAILSCLQAPLATIQPSIDAGRWLVSFRFELSDSTP